MHVLRPDSLPGWLDRARPFLRRREAEHGLLLGLAENAADPPPGAVWALVLDEGDVVAAALGLREDRLVLSTGPAAAHALLAPALLAPAHRQVVGPPDALQAFLAAGGRPHRPAMAQGVHELRELIPPPPVPGAARPARPDEVGFLAGWSAAFHAEALPHEAPRPHEQVLADLGRRVAAGHLHVWETDGRVVSQTGTAGPTRGPGARGGGRRVNAVYTPPEERGKGYAAAVVAAVTRGLLDAGHDFAFLYTDLANPTSNALYRRLGYRHVADAGAALLDPA